MRLWKVDVAGVSHRYVEADTEADALLAVTDAIVSALDLQVEPAESAINRAYVALGKHRRKSTLAALDGLTTPSGVRAARHARRRLARQIRYDLARRAWLAETLSTAPPMPDPEVLANILKAAESAHVRRVQQRLHDSSTGD